MGDDYETEHLLTIGRFSEGRPVGVAWQRRSSAAVDGWLYGEVNGAGQFTGAAITFLYPGMRRGLRGAWEDGRIVAATAVKVGLRVTSPAGVGSKVQRRHA